VCIDRTHTHTHTTNVSVATFSRSRLSVCTPSRYMYNVLLHSSFFAVYHCFSARDAVELLLLDVLSSSSSSFSLLNNNNNNNHGDIYGAIIMTGSLRELKVEQRQAAADHQTKPPDLGCESACFRQIRLQPLSPFIIIRLLSPKAE